MEGEPIPKPSAALEWIGILAIIVGFFLAVGSIRFTGWFVPITLTVFISYVEFHYLLAVFQSSGITFLEKHLNAIEPHGKKKWVASNTGPDGCYAGDMDLSLFYNSYF